MESIRFLLFLSLLSHSILLAKSNEDDDLLKGIQDYRASVNLTALPVSSQADCIADDIVETYQAQTCNASALNATALNVANFPTYVGIMMKCRMNPTNASGDGMILPTCIPSQNMLNVSDFTSKYAAYLNSTQFSRIGVGSEGNWLVVLVSNVSATGPANGAPGPTNGAPGLTLAAVGPAVLSLISLFMLV